MIGVVMVWCFAQQTNRVKLKMKYHNISPILVWSSRGDPGDVLDRFAGLIARAAAAGQKGSTASYNTRDDRIIKMSGTINKHNAARSHR